PIFNRVSLGAGVLALNGSQVLATSASADRGWFNVRRFGAKGNGVSKDTATIQKAIDAAGKQGGCVYFPPGRYLCGTVQLRSHITVRLESGATLVAGPERSDCD